jgi:hypothetical protein
MAIGHAGKSSNSAQRGQSKLCKVRFSRNEAGMSFRINKTVRIKHQSRNVYDNKGVILIEARKCLTIKAHFGTIPLQNSS